MAGVLDETLRDGLQSASVRHPTLEEKLELLHHQDALGLDVTTIGIPCSSSRVFEDCVRLCLEADRSKMRISIVCAARTLEEDVRAVLRLVERVGRPVELYTFIGSSPIRHYVEDWDVRLIAQRSADAIKLGVAEGLRVAYVTEDTTRSHPDTLRELFKVAIDSGATRLCLADTVGHATPHGTQNLVRFTRGVIEATGAEVGIDWHGHNDRGLAVPNAIAAMLASADRIHATALGIGERTGNVRLEHLLPTMDDLGRRPSRTDRAALGRYLDAVTRAVALERKPARVRRTEQPVSCAARSSVVSLASGAVPE